MELAFPTPLPWPQSTSWPQPAAQADPPTQLPRLLHLLKRVAGHDETLSFGGLQHLLNRHQERDSSTQRLPDSLLLAVFAHLSAGELGVAAQVCSQWQRVAGDELLWRFMLRRDARSWVSLGHEANPDLFEATGADLGSKERYLRCSPAFRHSQARLGPAPWPLTSLLPALLRRAWPSPPPKLAFLGPGLDAGCSGLARKLLADPTHTFSIGKPFPGIQGVGAGFHCSFTSTGTPTHFRLTFLYSGPRQEREAGRENRLFVRTDAGTVLAHSVKELSASLNGLVFIVDAVNLMDEQRASEARAGLHALAEHCWSAGTPVSLLVLSLLPVGDSEENRQLSCMDVIRLLDLNNIRLAWRVYSGDIETAAGLCEGLRWLTEHIEAR